MAEQQNDDQSEVAESFGDFLKRHREASGKSLDEIARVTRISKRYLVAFEENDNENYPEEAFARGFLRSYAHEVGLDVDECLSRLERFQRSLMPTQIRDMRKQKKQDVVLGVAYSKPAPGLWLVGVILVVIVVGLSVFYFFDTTPDPTASQQETVVEEPAEGGRQVQDNTGSFVDSGQSNLVTPVPPSVLQISAKDRVTFVMRLDESASQEIVIDEGETKSFDVYRQVEIKGVDAQSIELLFNGQAVKSSGRNITLLNKHMFSK